LRSRIGHLRGAIDPGTASFPRLSPWFRAHRDARCDRHRPQGRDVLYTGGIRGEKADRVPEGEGVDEVYHLKGGILAYLDTVAARRRAAGRANASCSISASPLPTAWRSDRTCSAMAADAGERGGSHSPLLCRGGQLPRLPRQPQRRSARGYAERHRQTRIAESRGVAHVGAQPRQRDAD
jgi:UPF0176 protein